MINGRKLLLNLEPMVLGSYAFFPMVVVRRKHGQGGVDDISRILVAAFSEDPFDGWEVNTLMDWIIICSTE